MRRAIPHPPHLSLAVVLSLALAGCDAEGDGSGAHATPADEAPPGRLVIVGGALAADNADVYQAILDGRDGGGPLCVLPTASGVPEESMASAVERFDVYGGAGTAEGILLSEVNAQEAEARATADRIARCSGFFFTGGDQSRIFQVFRPGGMDTPAYTALVERWREGAVVSGSSAGAAMMSQRAITGGNSVDALRHGVAAGDDAPGVRLDDGTEFVPWATLDQHFLARGRWGRLLVALVSDPRVTLGVGIDENTALVVEDDEGWVTGASGVIWMDGRTAALDPGDGTGAGITLHLLGAGDRVELSTGAVTRGPAKAPLDPARPGGDGGAASGAAGEPPAGHIVPVAPDDAFERWAFLHLLSAFAASELESMVVGPADRPITLEKAPDFTAVSAGKGGVQGTPAGLSVGPVRVSLDRVRQD